MELKCSFLMKHDSPDDGLTDYELEGIIFVPQQGPPRRQGYWNRLGGGSLAVSIIVHGAFVIIALLIIWRTTVNVESVPFEFLPGGGRSGGGSDALAVKKRRAVSHAQPRMILAGARGSSYNMPNAQLTLSTIPALASLPMRGGGPGSGEGPGGDGIGEGIGKGIGIGSGPGRLKNFVSIPLPMRGRCSPAERLHRMNANGGNDQCEAAVKRSLQWLKEKQNKDGSWGESHRAGMTGLALLAYLGHCETPESFTYGETVLKGLTYLLELGQKNKAPFDGIFSEKPAAISSTYEHGIAAYAMGEMYSFSKLGTTPIPGLRESFERGAAIIIEKQNERGAWGYKEGVGYDSYGRDDLSVTGWQFQALKAATHTNLKIPGLSPAIRKVEKYLESTQTPDGGFGNPNRNQHYNQWNLTGAALLGLQTLGSGNAGKITKGVRWLVEEVEKEPLNWNSECYLYTWYYNTQALFQKGGAPWKVWNDQFRPLVIDNQSADGSYKPEGAGQVGSAATGAAGADKDIYRVCLCTLMLEVYYRYLKVGDRSGEAPGSLVLPK